MCIRDRSWLLAFMPRAQHVIELGTGTFAVLGLHEPIDSVVLAFDPLAPVSYTHLDVYKRQVYTMALLELLPPRVLPRGQNKRR